jgi:cyclic-di-GMP phosphodiesterase, flagellum assembly factor TipF
VRIGAIFIASCMVLIAASFGAVLYLRLGFSASDSALAGLGLLTVLALYNAVTGRRRDRAVVNDQVASLARGSGDLARQVAEFGRRLVHSRKKSAIPARSAGLATRRRPNSRWPARSRNCRGWSGSLPIQSPSTSLP